MPLKESEIIVLKSPLIDFYMNKGILVSVNGMGGFGEVTEKVVNAIERN